MATAATFLSCPLCYEDYGEPMRLTCDHRICRNCVAHLETSGQVKCPECKTCMSVGDVMSDADLKKVLDNVTTTAGRSLEGTADIECVVCKDRLYRWRCVECDQKLCEVCKMAHDAHGGDMHTIEQALPLTLAEVTALEKRADECSKIIEKCTVEKGKLELSAAEMEREKNDILGFLRRSQQQIVDMVNSYFTSLDEAYGDATPEEMDVINDKMESLRNDPNDPIKGLKALQVDTSALLANMSETGIEHFKKIRELHLEQIELFRGFYGTPFKLLNRVGNETRRYSNLERSKMVLEALRKYDAANRHRVRDAATLQECLPTVSEIVEISGLTSNDVIDVANMFAVVFRDYQGGSGNTVGGDEPASGETATLNDAIATDNNEAAVSESIANVDIATTSESINSGSDSAVGTGVMGTVAMGAMGTEGTLQYDGEGLFAGCDSSNDKSALCTDLEHLNLGEIDEVD